MLKSELLEEIENELPTSLEEAEQALGQMYSEASDAIAPLLYPNLEEVQQLNKSISISFAGSNLWERLRKFLCGFLSADSTVSEIIDKIVEFLASWVPGGIIIKWLVRKVVRYVLNLGYNALCPS